MTDTNKFDRSIIVKVLTQNENQYGIWFGVEDALGNRYSAFRGTAQKFLDDNIQEGERIRIQGAITQKGEKRYYNINAFEREIGVHDDMEEESPSPPPVLSIKVDAKDALIIREVAWKEAAKSSTQLAAAGIKAGLFTTIEQAQEWRNKDSVAYERSIEEDILR